MVHVMTVLSNSL